MLFYQGCTDGSAGREEVYESIGTDFPGDILAKAAICERFLAGVDPNSSAYPVAVNDCVMDFSKALQDCPSMQLWQSYSSFLMLQSTKTTEQNLVTV